MRQTTVCNLSTGLRSDPVIQMTADELKTIRLAHAICDRLTNAVQDACADPDEFHDFRFGFDEAERGLRQMIEDGPTVYIPR